MGKSIYFRSIERLDKGQTLALKDILDEVSFDDNGLIPVVTQDAVSQEVLMLAWMNKNSIQETLSTGRMTYWSRSRRKKWVKGETSGNFVISVVANVILLVDALTYQGVVTIGLAAFLYRYFTQKL